MIKYRNLFLSLCVMLLLASCGVQYNYNRVKSTSLTPDVVRLNLDLENFELLGETKISVNYRTYLGFITSLDSINDRAYNRRAIDKVAFKGFKDFRIPRYLKKAAYKVIEAYPDADYYVPAYTHTSILKLFLGRSTEREMVIKAYKLK